ncbi:MAG: hypothetical protein KJZ65_07370 [Phycisphaerales bacterium]|nr:hypothetical protein [Phycisphaerales bacterium]
MKHPVKLVVLERGLVLIALAVSLISLYAGLEKWSDIEHFRATIVSHRLLSGAAAEAAAVAMASVEVGVGVFGLGLILMRGPGVTALVPVLDSALFAGFAAYAAGLVVQPPPEPTSCGCGMWSAPMADWADTLTRNAITSAALGAGAMLAIWSKRRADRHADGSGCSITVAAR